MPILIQIKHHEVETRLAPPQSMLVWIPAGKNKKQNEMGS